MSLYYQVWCFTEATEAIASVAPGLCLGALWNVPIANYKLPCPFKYEVSGLYYNALLYKYLWVSSKLGQMVSIVSTFYASWIQESKHTHTSSLANITNVVLFLKNVGHDKLHWCNKLCVPDFYIFFLGCRFCYREVVNRYYLHYWVPWSLFTFSKPNPSFKSPMISLHCNDKTEEAEI